MQKGDGDKAEEGTGGNRGNTLGIGKRERTRKEGWKEEGMGQAEEEAGMSKEKDGYGGRRINLMMMGNPRGKNFLPGDVGLWVFGSTGPRCVAVCVTFEYASVG